MRWLRLIAGMLPTILLPAFAQTADPPSNSAAAISGTQQATPPALNVCGFEVLNKTYSKDLGAYSDNILIKVRGTWDKLIVQAKLIPLPAATTLVELVIKKDGSEAKVRTAESSGNQSLDAIALQAVSSVGPFGPFPPEFHEKELKLRYHFGYNQPSSADAPICGKFRPTVKAVAMKPGGPISHPTAKFAPDPEYSEQARRAKYQGLVTLGGVVDENGSFQDVCVWQGAGMGLDEKAIEAVKTWKFEPANRQGIPVAVYISVQVNFRLY